MLTWLVDTLFGCRHSNYSFPITINPGRRGSIPARTGTYVACLDCGRDLAYDWNQMKVVGSRTNRSPLPLHGVGAKTAPALRFTEGG